MTAYAGNIIYASDVNGLGLVYVGAGTSLSVTATTGTDIPSATVTFSVSGANAFCTVFHATDITSTVTASNNVMQIFVVVDGAAVGASETLCDDRVSRHTVTGGGGGKITLSAGSHTIKLQANRAAAAGTWTVNDSIMEVTVYDIN